MYILIAVFLTLSLIVLAYVNTSCMHCSRKTVLKGAGSTFVYPQVVEWSYLYREQGGYIIFYQPVGSGAGLRMFLKDQLTDFACSDPPLDKKLWEQYKERVIQIPWLLGAVVIVYNLPEIPENYSLRLNGVVLAKMFKGEITYWNDSLIKELNPEVVDMLPGKPIIVVHRSDASGTTEVFTKFLRKASRGVWPENLVGKTIEWPVDATGRGVGAKGNEGVLAIILQTPYSIGYVEWSYVHAAAYKLPIASIENAEGEFVVPTTESIMEAAKHVSMPSSPLDDFSYTLDEIVYARGKNSYPLATFTYFITWVKHSDSSKNRALADFLDWITKVGYNHVIPGYAPPPESVVELLKKAVSILRKYAYESEVST